LVPVTEEKFIRLDGTTVDVDVAAAPIGFQDAAASLVIIRDITERKRAEEKLQRQFKELTVLHAVGQAITQSSNSDELITLVTDAIGETLFPLNFGVLLVDEKADLLRHHPSYRGDATPEERERFSIPLGQGITGTVARSGMPRRVADTSLEPEYLAVNAFTRSELCVPIMINGKVIGVINAEGSTPGAFTEDDERLLMTIASQVCIAMEKLQLLETERLRRQEAETLRQAATALTSSLELDRVLENLLDQVAQVIPYDSASIFLLEENHLRVVKARGFPHLSQLLAEQFDADDALFAESQKSLAPLILENAQTEPRFKGWGGTSYARGWMGVPIIVRDQAIGYLTLDNQAAGAYTHAHADLALALASQAAVAIANARLFDAARSRAEQLALLYDAGLTLNRILEPREQLEELARITMKALHADNATFFRFDAVRDEICFELNVGRNVNIDQFKLARFKIGEERGLVGLVAQNRQPLYLQDVTGDPRWIQMDPDIRSVLWVPIEYEKKLLGVFAVACLKTDAFTLQDIQLLVLFVNQISVAMENARLFAEIRRRLNELESINRISTSLRVARTAEQMLPCLMDETLKILESSAGVIWLYHSASGMLERAEARGWFTLIHEEPVQPGEGFAGTVFETGTPIISKEFYTDELTREPTRLQIPPGWGGACVPIRAGDEIIGVLFVSVQLPRQLNESDASLLTTISEIAGSAIHRSSLYEHSQRQLQRLASLRAIDLTINTTLDLRVTLDILINHIMTQLKVDAVTLLLMNPSTQTLQRGASAGFWTDAVNKWQPRISEDLSGWVAQSRSLVFVPNLSAEPRYRAQLFKAERFVAYFGIPLMAKGQVKGILEIYQRSYLDPDAEWKNFLEILAGQAAIAIDNATLFEDLQRTNVDLSLAYDATIEGWSRAMDLRDRDAEGHTLRVADLTVKLAERIGFTETDLIHVRRGALLHDIGEMGVPDSILQKPGALVASERKIVQLHPEYAHEMLSPISYLRPSIDIPHCHHEHWDGTGYPRELKGEQIPLAARIFAVVDVWDALTSDRPYRKAWSRKRTLKYIQENSGSHFDPAVVDAFVKMIEAE
jgi:GAF domain-containing protein